ncbi:IclR family transcriptional regulator [Metabacillus rhizolycopersici]|uniref:IclR family transcriptional regulator n=1 Tax=Metabacillus rhizolycopersici TaxID=2875709 RepID=A0ABS7UX67_9BACI|nr:IclR family transcriptional regulator [Metabacillus rhizolycopersici]MBZ5752741.1 IclR family transcriptional regulator [Metabacillus rhizolycopersici]
MSKYEVSTLKKGLQILELLKINRSLTLREISEMLQLTKTTAFRLVNTLEDMDYIKKRGKYFELNQVMFLSVPERKTSIDWITLRSPYRLGMSVGENVYIGTLDGTKLVMQQMIKPPFKEPFHEEIGNRSPAHQSAIGKVILAHLNPNERKELFSHLSLTQATDHTFIDQELFFHHLDVIKKQGFAIDDEERFLGVRCIAAPVFRNNQIIAAVAIAGPSESIKRSILRSLTRKVINGSKEITNEIE